MKGEHTTEQELELLEEIFVQDDVDQTYINYVASHKRGTDALMQFCLCDNPESLHYEMAFRIAALLDIIETNNSI